MEVEATVSNVMGLKDATSYGVEIPGTDGSCSFCLCHYNVTKQQNEQMTATEI